LEGKQLLKHIDNTFKQFCVSDGCDFSHYFRTLYHLIELVNKNPILDKAHYIGLVRAQLPNDEIVLLFYHGLSEQGGEFNPLIENYALLKNWREHKAFQGHHNLYSPEAYGN
jgi:Putative phage abortive infection protein